MAGASSRCAVVGAGIVGLACAYHLNRAGHNVVLVDRDPEGDRTSFGNAGAVAVAEILPLPSPGIARKVPGFLFDPLGPLSIRLRYLPWLVPYLRHFLAASTTAVTAARSSPSRVRRGRRTHSEPSPVIWLASLIICTSLTSTSKCKSGMNQR